MATESNFLSLEYFKAWGERLANAGLETLTNTLFPKAVSAGTPTVTPGSVVKSAVTWLPYVLIGAAAFVLVLVLKKR